MFSYRAWILQTSAAKRAENRFNGAVASSSGERAFDEQDKFFALDSSANMLHSGITSQTISVAGLAKLMFACQPCCGYCNSPDPVVFPQNLDRAARRRRRVPGQFLRQNEEEREMKTLACYAISIALCLGVVATLAIGNHGVKSISSSEAHLAANTAFQDGVYLGKLAAEGGQEMKTAIAIGRWSSDQDRFMFTTGYRRGHNATLAGGRQLARLDPAQ
jgi:hypothetical protein